MADNLKKQPKKGILKNSSSFESEERQKEMHKGTQWDEMNIIATLHPKDKDYGHMKIEEPKTPYSYNAQESDDEIDGIDADLLAQKIKQEGNDIPKVLHKSTDDSSEEEEESPEERAKRKMFEMKRKHHYNEFAAVKLARKLMEDDDEKEDENIIEEEEACEEQGQNFSCKESSEAKSADHTDSG